LAGLLAKTKMSILAKTNAVLADTTPFCHCEPQRSNLTDNEIEEIASALRRLAKTNTVIAKTKNTILMDVRDISHAFNFLL
jgi:hypothetical protein